MRILHISGARTWGGNEQQLADLVPELDKLGVVNIIFGMEDSPLHQHFRKKSSLFISTSERKIHRKANIAELRNIIQEQKPDLIHLHTSDSVTLFVVADLLYHMKIPAVLSKKGMGSSMSILSKYKYNYKNLKKIICVSKAVKQELEEKVISERNRQKLVVVYDGVNLERTKQVRNEDIRELFSIGPEARILGNIANHAKAKDLGVLIKMMDYLVNSLKISDIHLVQLGSFSTLTDELKAQIGKFKLQDHISLGGFQENALDFMPQFDLYVMSSEREGLPITIFEAFYKGTPVVSTMAGGIPEAIVDRENGFLAEVKDPKGLAEKVAELLENTELQRQFSLKSEKIFYQNFLSEITAKKTLEIYKTVLEI